MENQQNIDVLNTLVEINNDRIEGYRKALEETSDADLKILFSQFLQNSQKCKAELISELTNIGGTPVEGTRTSGKFFRAWMDIKAALTGNDREAILNSCEYGEDVAVGTYRDVLNDDIGKISLAQQTLINSQYNLLQGDHNKVKEMRDAVVHVK